MRSWSYFWLTIEILYCISPQWRRILLQSQGKTNWKLTWISFKQCSYIRRMSICLILPSVLNQNSSSPWWGEDHSCCPWCSTVSVVEEGRGPPNGTGKSPLQFILTLQFIIIDAEVYITEENLWSFQSSHSQPTSLCWLQNSPETGRWKWEARIGFEPD